MPTAFKRSIKKYFHQFGSNSWSDYSSSHTENVGVIMSASHFSGEMIGTAGSPNAMDFIGGHGNANTSAAKQQAFFAFTVYDCVCHLLCNKSIVAGLFVITAVIFVRNLFFLQVGFDLRF